MDDKPYRRTPEPIPEPRPNREERRKEEKLRKKRDRWVPPSSPTPEPPRVELPYVSRSTTVSEAGCLGRRLSLVRWPGGGA